MNPGPNEVQYNRIIVDIVSLKLTSNAPHTIMQFKTISRQKKEITSSR